MNRQSLILILEDNASDAELERRELRKSGLEASVRVAADRTAYLEALDEFVPDLILADYSLPGFDGLTALALARQRLPDVPVVIVSGVIGEETAVDALKAGATDYVLKDRLFRLGPVARRALLEAEQRAETRRAEDALRDSEALLRALTDNSPDAIFVKDLQSRWLMANPAVLRIVGKSAQEALGHTDLELYADPETGRAIVENDRRVVESGVPGEFEEVVVAPDGQRTFLSIKAPRRNAQGHIVGIVGISRDITDRKRAQEKLKKAYAQLDQKVRERTEELRNANTTLRMIWECNETLLRASDEEELMRQVCRIIVDVGGYRMAWVGYAEDDEGKTVRPVAAAGIDDGYLGNVRISWNDVAHGRGPTGACIQTGRIAYSHDILSDPHLEPWRAAAVTRGFRSSIALPLISKGTAFGALTIYAGTPDAFDQAQTVLLSELAGDLAFGIEVLRTEIERDQARKTAERRAAQLRALATELVQTEQKERRRLAGILHDNLQQLLVSAMFSVTAIQKGGGSETTRRTAEQLADTLDEAIRASRSLSADLSPPVLHERGLAAGLQWLGRRMQERHGLDVGIETEAAAEPAAEQVRVFLFEAVRELLLNVVKHAQVSRACVHLRSLGGEEVEVTVADEGVGFDPAQLGVRASSEGGFGLFSIRERLDYLGGRMAVDAAPGRGSRFTIVAPAHRPSELARPEAMAAEPVTESAGRPTPPDPRPAAEPEHKIRVLIADDHAIVRHGFMRLLEQEPDIEVVGEAGDGEEAIILARQFEPDVVLMDVSMPTIDGYEATRQIVSASRDVRVIGLSMHEENEIAAMMRQAGAVAYVTKSDPPRILLDAIRACPCRKRHGGPNGN
jgi:PAS domain S-box-containing protein